LRAVGDPDVKPLFEQGRMGTAGFAFADRSSRIIFLESDQGSYYFREQRKPMARDRFSCVIVFVWLITFFGAALLLVFA